jgi:hypothetical protein
MSTQPRSLFGDLPIRPVTRHLVERLFFDMPLSPAAISDFGITSEVHYRALKEALFAAPEDCEADDAEEMTLSGLHQRIVTLDAALGHGERLTAWVAQHAPHYDGQVRFRTVWDILFERVPAQQT